MALRFVVATVLIPSGLLKIQGKRFSAICPEMYAGSFFTELHHTGTYWKFLGFCQLLTALLLFTQRYTSLAALLFFGICSNIFVFTLSVGLDDKSLIMIFMIAAAFLLIVWDWYRIKPLFSTSINSHISYNIQTASNSLQIIGLVAYVAVTVFLFIFDTYY
ncbi:MAG: DoxX family membrane protein [Myroides sp.]